MTRLLDFTPKVLADRQWRAALFLLTQRFDGDREVWARVLPGEACELAPLADDPLRSPADRLLLTAAHAYATGSGWEQLPVMALVGADDDTIALLLQSLAIMRGKTLPTTC